MSENILEKQLFEIIKDEEMAENIKLAKLDMLIKLGVDVNAMYGAKSALMLANEVKEEKIAKFLEENGAKEFFDEEIAKELGKKLIEVCANGEKKDVKELIDMGADVNQKDKDGWTALMCASYRGCKEVVELLIEKGADVNAKTNGGKTALMEASAYGDKEIIELLIQNGADVNQKNNNGQNAMMLADNEEIKKVIIEAVKKRNEKTGENVIVQGIERE